MSPDSIFYKLYSDIYFVKFLSLAMRVRTIFRKTLLKVYSTLNGATLSVSALIDVFFFSRWHTTTFKLVLILHLNLSINHALGILFKFYLLISVKVACVSPAVTILVILTEKWERSIEINRRKEVRVGEGGKC